MRKSYSQRLKTLLNSKRTVFRTKDLEKLWQENSNNTIITARRMVEKGIIIKLAKGYYAIDEECSNYELANLIISPSYISFNSALFYWGVNFQLSDRLESVANIYYNRKVGEILFVYHAMKSDIFFNSDGIKTKDNISIAAPERALLDCFYFGINANIDDWDKINRSTLYKLMNYYPKITQDKIKKIKL